jgi:cytochrome b
MKRVLIWDWSTRVLHWALAGSVTLALVLGLAVDDDHPLFGWHMVSGLAAGLFAGLRILLGVVGSRHARFGAWTWSPRELVAYARGVLTGRARQYVSHNPGTTWAAAGFLALVPLLIVTGLVGGGETFEDAHEVLAYALLALIGLHLAGLALHTVRHRENIAWSMVDGRKQAPVEAALTSSGAPVGIAVAALATVGTVGLLRGYDPATGRVQVPLVGLDLQLGESERGELENEHGERGEPRRADGHHHQEHDED